MKPSARRRLESIRRVFSRARAISPERFRRFIDRHGRWLTMNWRDVEKVQGHFERHGAGIVFVGRMIPALRTFISIPPGILRMTVSRYLLWSTQLGNALGSASAHLDGLGRLLAEGARA